MVQWSDSYFCCGRNMPVPLFCFFLASGVAILPSLPIFQASTIICLFWRLLEFGGGGQSSFSPEGNSSDVGGRVGRPRLATALNDPLIPGCGSPWGLMAFPRHLLTRHERPLGRSVANTRDW